MEGHVRAALLAAFRHVFQPLVRLALRNGISYQEFCTGLKRVFVETVQADFQIPGQEMTPARIGILTGLTREDVSFVQEEIERGIGDELIIMGRPDRRTTTVGTTDSVAVESTCKSSSDNSRSRSSTATPARCRSRWCPSRNSAFRTRPSGRSRPPSPRSRSAPRSGGWSRRRCRGP